MAILLLKLWLVAPIDTCFLGKCSFSTTMPRTTLLFACSFVVVGSCLSYCWVFSLGVDNPIVCESNPQ